MWWWRIISCIDSRQKGHASVKNMENLKNFCIPKLKIEQVIASCVSCILIDRERVKKERLLHL